MASSYSELLNPGPGGWHDKHPPNLGCLEGMGGRAYSQVSLSTPVSSALTLEARNHFPRTACRLPGAPPPAAPPPPLAPKVPFQAARGAY